MAGRFSPVYLVDIIRLFSEADRSLVIGQCTGRSAAFGTNPHHDQDCMPIVSGESCHRDASRDLVF